MPAFAFTAGEYFFFSISETAGNSQIYSLKQSGLPIQAEWISFDKIDSRVILFETRIQKSTSAKFPQKISENKFAMQWSMENKVFSVLFFGFKEGEVVDIAKKISAQYPAYAVVKSRGIASEAAVPNQAISVPDSASGAPKDYLFAFGQNAYACWIQGAPQGVKAALIDPFTDFSKSAWLMMTNFGQWWKNSLDQWEAVKDFFSDFKKNIGMKWEDFKRLPESEKSKAYCQYLASAAASGKMSVDLKSLYTKHFSKLPNIEKVSPKATGGAVGNEGSRLLEIAKKYPDSVNVSEKNGKFSVKIIFLNSDEQDLNVALLRAIKAGLVDSIDAGDIIAPKSLILLNQLKNQSAAAENNVKFSFQFNVRRLWSYYQEDLGARNPADPKDVKFVLSEKDKANFEQAWKDLKVKQACKELFTVFSVNSCGRIIFETTSQSRDVRFFAPVSNWP